MKSLLVANRGEIAVRVMRSAKEMGIKTIAVYSEADRDAAHVSYADEAYLAGGASPAQSYLNIARLLDIAHRSAADAIHPGYGFLAENAAFARAVIAHGFTWVGPSPEAIETMGDKLRARHTMKAAGVPIVPGGAAAVASIADAEAAVREFGLPIALKASGGGGGKGLKIARSLGELTSAFATARREAEAYFGNGTIYVERYLENPKHIELQIVADKHGAAVHVGERDCSLQRRHQKLLEETPARIDEDVRFRLREAGVRAAKAIGYDSVGTIETLVQGDDFYFLEMNTRIQVEHTISEMTSGLDLVREQLRVAADERLGYEQADIELRGHAIEVRVNAEDPAHGFRPAPGTITGYREPAGLGIRVDSAAGPGFKITPDYDSLIAKLIVWDRTRERALARLRRAIADYQIEGVPTTLPFFRELLNEPRVLDATYGTATLERVAERFAPPSREDASPSSERSLFSGDASEAQTVRVEVNDKLFTVRILDGPPRRSRSGALPKPPRPMQRTAGSADSTQSGKDIVAPMHGVIVDIAVGPGENVAQGQMVAVIEAMKMMNEIYAHRAGMVAAVLVEPGATVEAQTTLMRLA